MTGLFLYGDPTLGGKLFGQRDKAHGFGAGVVAVRYAVVHGGIAYEGYVAKRFSKRVCYGPTGNKDPSVQTECLNGAGVSKGFFDLDAGSDGCLVLQEREQRRALPDTYRVAGQVVQGTLGLRKQGVRSVGNNERRRFEQGLRLYQPGVNGVVVG